MDTGKIEHLKMIQDVIKRMADNSSRIKRWAIMIIVAVLAVSMDMHFCITLSLCIAPCIMMWWLDSYYLTQERQYRELFNDVRNDIKNNFDMDASEYRNNIPKIINSPQVGTMFSRTEIGYYGALILILLVTRTIIACY